MGERKQLDLSQFYGDDVLYRYPLMPGIVYTAGAQHVFKEAGAYWLLGKIATNQLEPKIRREKFQVWELKVKDGAAVLTCDDGDGNVVHREKIEPTDFPEPGVKFYYGNRTIYLPSEY